MLIWQVDEKLLGAHQVNLEIANNTIVFGFVSKELKL
jgi:hypothetical protein